MALENIRPQKCAESLAVARLAEHAGMCANIVVCTAKQIIMLKGF